MKTRTSLLLVCVLATSSCLAEALPVTSLTTFDAYNIGKGRQLMTLLEIPYAVSPVNMLSWNSPTSIMMNAQRFVVDIDSKDGDYKIVSSTNSNERIAYGSVCVMNNGADARLGAFAWVANCSVPVEGMASYVKMQTVDVHTNVFYLTYSIQSPRTPVYYVHKNVCLEVHAATNRLEIANALMNAGLPENERVPLNGNGGTQNP